MTEERKAAIAVAVITTIPFVLVAAWVLQLVINPILCVDEDDYPWPDETCELLCKEGATYPDAGGDYVQCLHYP